MKPIKFLRSNPLMLLLIAFPLAVASELAAWGDIWTFIFSVVAIVPLAGMIGQATEALASYTGPKIGGLLNATLGNAAELIITLVAIKAGYLDLVKASITGSILGNLLFVLGVSMLVGGFRNGVQTFDRKQAANHTVLLTLSVTALVIPSLFRVAIGTETSMRVEVLSIGVAVVMLLLYIGGLIYSFKHIQNPITHVVEVDNKHHPEMKLQTAITLLVIATLGVVYLSEMLVGAVEHVVSSAGISEFFLGIILIPIVGNAAEHFVAVQMAHRNKMELSVEIAISSSLQIALFVAPILVFISLLMGHPLTLVFNNFELLALGAGVLLTVLVAGDGESNWLEGLALLGVYLILALAFFLFAV